MTTSRELRYQLSPAWTITQQGKSLVVSGGADARYEIELEDDGPSLFADVKPGSSLTRSKLSARDDRVLEELITAEIIVPVLQKHKTLRVSIVGDAQSLGLASHHNAQTADLLLVVRTNSTYAQLLEKIEYQGITTPHLFIDMAFHHTFSVGPLVFPGETACIACLQGRVSTRWGDETPPVAPKVSQQYGGVITELVAIELKKLAQQDTSLTNKTVSWNFLDRTTKANQLLKVPLCPICTQNTIDRNGVLALPW